MAELRRQGRRTSRFPPFGFGFVDGELVPEPTEQATLDRIVELREDGHGARRIARVLNDAGQANPRTGRPWNRGTLQSILKTIERRSVGGG